MHVYTKKEEKDLGIQPPKNYIRDWDGLLKATKKLRKLNSEHETARTNKLDCICR